MTIAPDVQLRVENLSKRYRATKSAQSDLLATTIFGGIRDVAKMRDDEGHIWALRGVSAEVRHGEVVGVIGLNGAGKSTFLRILSAITAPSEGTVTVRGRVSPLLEAGAGFHGELTGRDNVRLNATLLGMTSRELKAAFDDIVEFAGVARFMDVPVKHYSSGMRMRLGFAVAAHLMSEVLLVDEVLAVGDHEFQQRCLGRIGAVAASGRTVLFVSHDMGAVQALCSRVLVFQAGRLVHDGAVGEGIAAYLGAGAETSSGTVALTPHEGRDPSSVPMLKSLNIGSSLGAASAMAQTGGPLEISVEFASANGPIRPALGLVITSAGVPVFGINNRIMRQGVEVGLMSAGRLQWNFAELPLLPGRYAVDLYLGDLRDASRDLDVVRQAAFFEVVAGDVTGTGQLPPAGSGPVWVNGVFSAVG